MTTIKTGEHTVWVSYHAFVISVMLLFFTPLVALPETNGAISSIIALSTGILVFTLNVLFTDVFTRNIMSGIFAGLSLSSIFSSVMSSVMLSLFAFTGDVNPFPFEETRFIYILHTLTIILLSLYAFSNKGRRSLRIAVYSLIAKGADDPEANEQIASDADAGQPPTPSLTSEEQTTSTSDGGAGLPPTPSLTSEEQTASDTETSGVKTERSPNTISGSDEEPDPHTVEITKEYDDD